MYPGQVAVLIDNLAMKRAKCPAGIRSFSDGGNNGPW